MRAMILIERGIGKVTCRSCPVCDSLVCVIHHTFVMTHDATLRRPFVGIVAALLVLVLLGAGCSGSTDSAVGEDASEDASEFSGLDGSLTEFAFDDVSEALISYLLEEPVTDNPDQDVFEVWIETQDALPVNDTFENPIKLRSDALRSFVLWTEGEDKQAGTDDDYFKTYRY